MKLVIYTTLWLRWFAAPMGDCRWLADEVRIGPDSDRLHRFNRVTPARYAWLSENHKATEQEWFKFADAVNQLAPELMEPRTPDTESGGSD